MSKILTKLYLIVILSVFENKKKLLTNKLFKIMAEEKTFVFQPDNMSMIAPLLANRGMDSATISALLNNNNGFNGNGLWVIFLFFLMGWGGNGFGGNRNNTEFLSAQMNNDTGRQLLQQAINGNQNAISQLASSLNVNVSQIQSAIYSLNSSVQNVSAQVGLTSQQVINAIQSGNSNIINQMAQNCCEVKNSITTQGYENRIANIEQTNILGSKIDAQTQLIQEKFSQLEMRELQNKLDAERAENTNLKNTISNYNQNAIINQIVTQATQPLEGLNKEVEAIKEKLPTTITIPLPTAAAYGLTPYALGGNVPNVWG